MTEITERPASVRRFPASVRNASFTSRPNGLDETEVRAFLDTLAEEIQAADSDRAALRAEVERLSTDPPNVNGHAGINAQTVDLFSQAQQVADDLVAEAAEQAQQLVLNARAQQHEMLQRAHEAAEVESVRAYAQDAQDQLRSVVDALNGQVDRLGEVRLLTDGSESHETPHGSEEPTADPVETAGPTETTPPSEETAELSEVGRYIQSSSQAFARSWEQSR